MCTLTTYLISIWKTLWKISDRTEKCTSLPSIFPFASYWDDQSYIAANYC